MPWRLLLATLILIHALPDFYARYPDLAFPSQPSCQQKAAGVYQLDLETQ
jgi:hypothetical protein